MFWVSNGAMLLSIVIEDSKSAKICFASSLMFLVSHSINIELFRDEQYAPVAA